MIKWWSSMFHFFPSFNWFCNYFEGFHQFRIFRYQILRIKAWWVVMVVESELGVKFEVRIWTGNTLRSWLRYLIIWRHGSWSCYASYHRFLLPLFHNLSHLSYCQCFLIDFLFEWMVLIYKLNIFLGLSYFLDVSIEAMVIDPMDEGDG